jgi:hypothetical protein
MEFFNKFVDSVFLCFDSITCFYNPDISVNNPFALDRCIRIFIPLFFVNSTKKNHHCRPQLIFA